MKRTIPLTQFEEEGVNSMKDVEKVKETYKKVLDIMAQKIEENDILQIFNYVMKEHPEVFIAAYESVKGIRLSPGKDITYHLHIHDVGPQKIQLIKTIREITGLGLLEAKNLVESAPVDIKDLCMIHLTSEEATGYAKRMRIVGAEVHILEEEK